MKLIKARAKKPLIEEASGGASVRHIDGQWRYIIECHGPWVQGKGHESSYMIQLSKMEMLAVMSTWMESLVRDEREAVKKLQQRAA